MDDVHLLARAYGWSEPDVLALRLDRRFAYLVRLEAEQDAELLGGGGG